MALKRCILEMGMGTDLHGRDYTRAAQRAVRDALWHNSLSFARAVGKNFEDMQVDVTIGIPEPNAVDEKEVLSILPYGKGQITVVHGGLEVPNEDDTDVTVIANAAIAVYMDL